MTMVLGVFILLGFLFFKGGKTLGLHLIFGSVSPVDALLLREQVLDGLFPAIVGTFLLVFCSMTFAIPIGVAAGIYMAEYARGWSRRAMSLFFDILAGIPSIVIGLAGLSLAIILHHHFSERFAPSLLISAIALAILVLPYIIRTTQIALESIDPVLRRTAPSLGASRLQNILRVLLPVSLPDILGGIFLAIGRCAEDTAVIMLTGAVVMAGIPRDMFSQYEALPFFIYYISSQYSSPEELQTGFGAAIILLFLCSFLLFAALWIQKRLVALLLYR